VGEVPRAVIDHRDEGAQGREFKLIVDEGAVPHDHTIPYQCSRKVSAQIFVF